LKGGGHEFVSWTGTVEDLEVEPEPEEVDEEGEEDKGYGAGDKVFDEGFLGKLFNRPQPRNSNTKSNATHRNRNGEMQSCLGGRLLWYHWQPTPIIK